MINPEQPDFDNTPASDRRSTYNYTLAEPQAPPAVTIVTPFYNIEPDIFTETVQSIRRQTFQQWEWIIVNDGSTQQETLRLLAELTQQDPRIKVIHLPENRGLSTARNAGLQAACADFAVLLDGDDLLEPTAVEKWLWFLFTRPQLGFTRGYSVRFGERPHLWTRSFEQIETFLTKNQMEPTAMIRRAIWQQSGGFVQAMRWGLEDWEFWLKCAAHGFWGATVPEYLNWYRLRPQQQRRWPALKNDEAILATRDELQQRYPRLFAGQLPAVTVTTSTPPLVRLHPPCGNTLAKPDDLRRVLLMSATPASTLQANLIETLLVVPVEVSICATQAGQPVSIARAASLTPDVFVLPNFLQVQDYPRFLLYFIASRQTDVVLVHGSGIGYDLLPFLKAYVPQLICVDYVDDDAAVASNIRYRAWLTHTLTDSPQRRDWIIAQGGDPALVEANPDWRSLLQQLKPASAPPINDQDVGRLLATLAVTAGRAKSSTLETNLDAVRPVIDLSGEELAGIVPARKLLKALGFKLGNQPGFHWLYRFKNFAKWIIDE